MAWWNLIPGLTPIVAYDAANTEQNGAALTELGGSGNPMRLNGQAVGTSSLNGTFYKAVNGTGGRAEFTAVNMPTSGVFIALVPRVRGVETILVDGPGATYFAATNKYHFNEGWSARTPEGIGVFDSGRWYGAGSRLTEVVAFAFDANGYRIYGDGGWTSVTYPYQNWPTTVTGVTADNGSNLNADLSAYGLFSGTATLADLQAIEAAIRAELYAGVVTPKLSVAPHTSVLAHQNYVGQSSFGKNIAAAVPIARQNVHFSGAGRIVGSVKEKFAPQNKPMVRQVFLISETCNHQVVAATWSDAQGGYTFELLDKSQKYSVISYDYKTNYRAVIADNLTPE